MEMPIAMGQRRAAASGMEPTGTLILPRASAAGNAPQQVKVELCPNSAERAERVPHNGAVRSPKGDPPTLFRLVENQPNGTLVKANTFEVVSAPVLKGSEVERALVELEEAGIAYSEFAGRYIVAWPAWRVPAPKPKKVDPRTVRPEDFDPAPSLMALKVRDLMERLDLADSDAERVKYVFRPSTVHLLAHLPDADRAATIVKLRELLGRKLNLKELSSAVNEERRRLAQDQEPENQDGRPEIVCTNRPLRDISADAMKALAAANDPPEIFVRGGSLARVRRDERGRPIVETMGDSEVRGRLTNVADFYRLTAKGRQHISPPEDVVRDIRARGTWPFPPLESIVECPVLRPNGTVLDRPGYDATTKLILKPAPGLAVPQVPDSPPREAVSRALALIDEAIGDFPYTDDASRANALALLLTPILRPAISGPVPMAIIDAPQAGTGKSLLAEVVTCIATGRGAAMMSAPNSDEEWRKRITALLSEGMTTITIDNVEGRITSASLAMALTASTWKDRLLGRSESVTLPQRATWMATGNNVRLGGDLPRRCYWIKLDAKMSRPWQRDPAAFRHPDLLRWVAERRGDLVGALLTIARAWYAAGRPQADIKLPVLGSFEEWATTVGGVLAFAGVRSFLGNLEVMYQQADEEAAAWEGFLTQWARVYGEAGVTVAQLARDARDGLSPLAAALPDDLSDVLDNPNASFQRRLGKALSKREGTRYGEAGVHLERAGKDTAAGVVLWRVVSDGTG